MMKKREYKVEYVFVSQPEEIRRAVCRLIAGRKRKA